MSVDFNKSYSSCASWDDQVEYWRAANQLSKSWKIKDGNFNEHFDNIKNEYIVKKSSSSCKFSDIKGIIYGGTP